MGQFKSDVLSAVESAMIDVGDTITNDFDEKFHSLIEEFYSHYTPKVYKRKGQMYDLNSTIGSFADEHGLSFFYRVDGEAIRELYDDPASTVAFAVFNLGLHGHREVAPPMSPPPASQLEEFRRNYIKTILPGLAKRALNLYMGSL